MDFGTVIKKYRSEKNVTQEEMACALFITPQAVSRWENGISMPDVTMIPKLVKYLGVSADILLGCGEPKQNPPSELSGDDMLCQDQINNIFGFPNKETEPRTKTVLVTDDAPFMRSMLCDILSRADYGVLSASDGAECLRLLESEKADICTLDIGMPETDGLEILAEIKKKYPETKVIMVSAKSTKENVLKARELGAEHFMAKPFNSNTFLKILASL